MDEYYIIKRDDLKDKLYIDDNKLTELLKKIDEPEEDIIRSHVQRLRDSIGKVCGDIHLGRHWKHTDDNVNFMQAIPVMLRIEDREEIADLFMHIHHLAKMLGVDEEHEDENQHMRQRSRMRG